MCFEAPDLPDLPPPPGPAPNPARLPEEDAARLARQRRTLNARRTGRSALVVEPAQTGLSIPDQGSNG